MKELEYLKNDILNNEILMEQAYEAARKIAPVCASQDEVISVAFEMVCAISAEQFLK